jgi:hypothetical protein
MIIAHSAAVPVNVLIVLILTTTCLTTLNFIAQHASILLNALCVRTETKDNENETQKTQTQKTD